MKMMRKSQLHSGNRCGCGSNGQSNADRRTVGAAH
jgi:hypothetical protein